MCDKESSTKERTLFLWRRTSRGTLLEPFANTPKYSQTIHCRLMHPATMIFARLAPAPLHFALPSSSLHGDGSRRCSEHLRLFWRPSTAAADCRSPSYSTVCRTRQRWQWPSPLDGLLWPHGPFRIVVESSANGLRNMWVHVMSRELEREPPEAHVLPIEDDIEVSPLFHWWLCRAADAYGPFDSAEGARRHGKLAGVSLYSPRYDEIHRPGRSWRPRWPSAAGPKPAYLFQLPCSWGALYFRAYWRRFVNFYHTIRCALAHPSTTLATNEVLAELLYSVTRRWRSQSAIRRFGEVHGSASW